MNQEYLEDCLKEFYEIYGVKIKADFTDVDSNADMKTAYIALCKPVPANKKALVYVEVKNKDSK